MKNFEAKSIPRLLYNIGIWCATNKCIPKTINVSIDDEKLKYVAMVTTNKDAPKERDVPIYPTSAENNLARRIRKENEAIVNDELHSLLGKEKD